MELQVHWAIFYAAAGKEGGLAQLLAKLPRTRWAERDETGATLLHLACSGPNVAAVVALLTSGLLDVNARDVVGATPAHFAAMAALPRALQVLCVVGADMRACDDEQHTPLEEALRWHRVGEDDACARVLVANGVRLSTLREDFRSCITPELEAFERGVLGCRAAVVAMLRVKHAGRLVRWDKFLLLEIALCIWSTRCDKGWQLH